MRLYANGVRIDTFSTSTNPNSSATSIINTNTPHRIGTFDGSTELFNGYLADIHFIDGQALDPTSFGEFDDNGIWQPIEYAGSYGTNGFHLPFSDNSTAAALGTDSSGAGNTWTTNNLSVTAGAGNDSLVDVPVNGAQTDTGAGGEVRGNYCTWNPLSSGTQNFLNGNLQITRSSAAYALARGTVGLTSGKWYWEYTCVTDANEGVGVCTASHAIDGTYLGQTVDGWAYYSAGLTTNGRKYNNGFSTYGAAWGNGDVIGIAFDVDAQKIWFSKNGTWQESGDPAAGSNAAYTNLPLGGPVFPATTQYASTTNCHANFGQRPFAYTAPSGFKALNTANLPAPVVTKPSTVFDAITYTGNGSSQSITTDFSPDFVWLKSRSNGTYSHYLLDIVRGNTQILFSNSTGAESPSSTSLTSFNSTGFTVGSDVGTNSNGMPFIAWTWDAGSSTVTNTQGSISSQVRANASAGFSIVTYSGNSSAGSTFGHGLGVAPQMVFIKIRNGSDNWSCYHASLGNNKLIQLNNTNAAFTSSDFNNTSPTSSVFSLGGGFGNNSSGYNYVAYCFAPVAGYSNAFSYSGNGSSDGPMVWLGFRPRLILLKRTDSANNWILIDSARDTYNSARYQLLPNLSDSEYTVADTLDILSNGFKLRDSNASRNASGGTYIGFAWAESPFQYARAR
jgi:hypothetical protein